MNAGILKYRIGIYKVVKEYSEYGNEKQHYELKTTCRCSMTEQASIRAEEFDEVLFKDTRKIQIYNYIKVDESDRILFNDKYYVIQSILKEPNYNRQTIVMSLVND